MSQPLVTFAILELGNPVLANYNCKRVVIITTAENMIRPLIVGVAIFALSSAPVAQAQSATSASPLFQAIHLTGDKYLGFKKSCLLMYADGQYHRETTRQEARGGRAFGDWQPTQVFEGTIPIPELQKVKEIVDSKDFRAVGGTLGSSGLPLSLDYGPAGVTPRGDMDFLEVSVAHPTGPHVFSVLWSTALRHSESPVKSFATWIDEVEKRKEGRLSAAANNCSTSPKTGTSSGLTKNDSTILIPRAISTPDPDYPPTERKAKHAGNVVVQVLVNVDGSVGQVSVKHGMNPKLDQSALDAIKKWKFAPARLVGVPIPALVDVEVGFYLY
jgi:TonB family protein